MPRAVFCSGELALHRLRRDGERPVHYLEFLKRLHSALEPRTYLEVGVRNGDSLALSRCSSVGVDPAFEIRRDLQNITELRRCTSDEYFSSLGERRPFGDLPIDLALIDGLHLSDYALRDFTNIERYCTWSSVIAIDDILPRNNDEGARERVTKAWTGDVYEVLHFLETHRPDLVLLRVDTEPRGMALVFCPDRERALSPDAMDALTRPLVMSDAHEVPTDVLERHGALMPESVVASAVWDALAMCRSNSDERAGLAGRRLVRTLLDEFAPTPPS